MKIQNTLLNASEAGNFSLIKQLIKEEKIDVNQTSAIGATPFWIACFYGYLDIHEFLANEPKTEVNHKNKDGITPFWIACFQGHSKVIKLLLGHERVNINATDGIGTSPFLLACGHNHNDLEILQLFIEKKARLNDANQIGQTAFFNACASGYLENVRLLVSIKEVDINKADNCNFSPFFIACALGRLEIVKFLLSTREIKVNTNEKLKGFSPLLISCVLGHTDIVEALLKSNKVTNVLQPNCDGLTAFKASVKLKNERMEKLLRTKIFLDILEQEGINCKTPVEIIGEVAKEFEGEAAD